MKWAQNLVLLGFSILCVWKADLYEPWMAEGLVSLVTTIAVIVSLFGWGKCVSTSSRWDLLWMLGLGLMGTASYILVLLTEVRFLPIVLIIGWAQAYRNRYSYDFPKLTRTHWLFSSLGELGMTFLSPVASPACPLTSARRKSVRASSE